ncbi:peroxisomal carnitine O-octanoyltransferase-like [Antedon mediterranea]|uniref:peroxisomal carnitine O-octanoyltransferase-like n=1 Tax=Antedon mediterranea TaxID=105859 RepID=UPI003AF602B5
MSNTSNNISNSSSGVTADLTFQYDESLPSLPLPSLQNTLTKYLDSVKPFLSTTEFLAYKEQVKKFEEGIGKTIHSKLAQKAKHSKNWVHEWWEEAYLNGRTPTAILGNMVGVQPSLDDIWPPEMGSQLSRASIYIYHMLGYWSSIRRQLIAPDGRKDKLSMHQLRSIFNCGRIPGIKRDQLIRSFKTEREGACGGNHIIVICNGHIFKMFPLDKNEYAISSHEIFRQLSHIKEKSRNRGQGIGSLTVGDRTSYAKSFQHLIELDSANERHVQDIISSILCIVLDDGTPQNCTQAYEESFFGPQPWNKWSDKALSVHVFENGVLTANCDHAPYDGMVMVLLSDYIHQQLLTTAACWPGEPKINTNAIMPLELIFTTDDVIAKAQDKAEDIYFTNAKNMEVLSARFTLYGKDELRKHNLHPDTSCQLAIQLAYYTMYSKPGPCYETAATRKFYKGRTETIRSTTPEAVEWCKAMLDPQVSIGERQTLFQVAYNKHNTIMQEATEGQGCDRHLFGIYCTAQEMGLPTPDIFLHDAYTKSGGGGNFVLSTSVIGYTPVHGGVAAMTQDGYGIFYRIAKDQFQLLVTGYNSCEVTSCHQFYNAICKAFVEIKDLMFPSTSKL